MDKKEFESKIVSVLESGIYDAETSNYKTQDLRIGGIAIEKAWQWIEQYGEQFEMAHKHAMNVLKDYILMTRDKWTEAKSDESKEHYSAKERFMITAERTIEENYKMYLEHPENRIKGLKDE